jgi:RNA polymerase sigma factor (sigma-70 family)
MASGWIFAYARGEVRTGRSIMPEPFHDPSGDSTFDTAYAANVDLLAYIVRVKFRVPASDAESLVQDVFLKFARDYATVRRPRSWLAAAAENASKNYWRDRAREVPLPADIDSWEHPTAGEMADTILTRLAARTALDQLNASCREVLRRFHLDGQSTEAIAEALGTTAGYIQLRLHLCRKRARALYSVLTRVHT